MTRTLYVFLFDERVGTLQSGQGKLSFTYEPQWLNQTSARALSLALPLQAEPFDNEAAQAFFAGLLPEGSLRKLLLRQFQLSDANTLGLLDEIGGECAGAVSLTTSPDVPSRTMQRQVRWLDDSQLHGVLDELPNRPMLAGDHEMRLSLAGAQDKLPVSVQGNRIGLALNGEPSTHILKPAIASLQDTVFNEAFCMTLAAAAKLPAAPVQIGHVNGVDYLLVERYDRLLDDSGKHNRLHQEDFCQALGRSSNSKYQHEGGPDLQDCIQLLRKHTRPAAPNLLQLIDYVLFNALIGNHDAHAKNFSLLYQQTVKSGKAWQPTLAPLYDALSTAVYPQLSKKMAMKIGSQYTFKGVMPRHWQQFASNNQFSPAQLKNRLLSMARRLPAIAEQVHSENPSWQQSVVIDAILTLIDERCATTLRRFDM